MDVFKQRLEQVCSISTCDLNSAVLENIFPLVSHVRFLCFQEYDASVIVTSPNVPYKGA